MNDENDNILDELKASWSNLGSPEFEDADDLPRDQETRAVVGWMQEVWQGIETPAFVSPRPRPSRFSSWQKPAALVAASLLVMLTIWSFADNKPSQVALSPTDVATTDSTLDKVEVAESGAVTTTVLEHGGLMLTKGRVRLILVQPMTMDEPTITETEK